jgi:hypothetical protein
MQLYGHVDKTLKALNLLKAFCLMTYFSCAEANKLRKLFICVADAISCLIVHLRALVVITIVRCDYMQARNSQGYELQYCVCRNEPVHLLHVSDL